MPLKKIFITVYFVHGAGKIDYNLFSFKISELKSGNMLAGRINVFLFALRFLATTTSSRSPKDHLYCLREMKKTK